MRACAIGAHADFGCDPRHRRTVAVARSHPANIVHGQPVVRLGRHSERDVADRHETLASAESGHAASETTASSDTLLRLIVETIMVLSIIALLLG